MTDLTALEQLARCWRLLSSVTDREIRERLEQYARELEARAQVDPLQPNDSRYG